MGCTLHYRTLPPQEKNWQCMYVYTASPAPLLFSVQRTEIAIYSDLPAFFFRPIWLRVRCGNYLYSLPLVTISNSIYFASIVPRLPSIRVGCARAPCQYNQFARSMHFSNKRVASLIVGMSLPVCAAWCWWGYSLHNQVCNLPTLFM